MIIFGAKTTGRILKKKKNSLYFLIKTTTKPGKIA